LLLPIPATKVSKPVAAPPKFMVPVPVVVVVSFTLSLRTKATLLSPYAILIIAVDAAAAGNTIVKSPAVDVLSPPKSMQATEALVAEEL